MKFIHRSGLTVDLNVNREFANVAICWTYKSGFRDDPQGLAGLIHVGEHMVFEQSCDNSTESLELRAARNGIMTGAKTLPDCTQITVLCQRGEVGAALRLHRPGSSLGELGHFESAVRAVEVEAEDSLARHQGHREPWVELHSRIYRSWDLAHDGFGYEVHKLKGRYGQVHDVLATAFSPRNCILTVSGDFENLDVHEYLDELPLSAKVLATSDAAVGRRRTDYADSSVRAESHIRGFATSGPENSLTEYMYLWLAVEALKLRLPNIDVSLGVFGPLRSLTPETLVVSDKSGRAVEADSLRNDMLRSIADPSESIFQRAKLHLQFALHQETSGQQGAVSTLGRLSALCGPHVGLDDLQAVWSQLEPSDLDEGTALLLAALEESTTRRPGTKR